MSRVSFHTVPAHKAATDFGRRWGLSLGLWGAGAGVAALYLLSVTPLVKREVLVKVPVLGSYWEDKTPASDKPF
ncbi:cytochrome b-c1 complex subunit 10 [Cristinia sonorae]|uniref:Cytochrome b-c1 complex subunit 10 n=1 Tax=Cristinia sonorae TaxID=1940300 RepID=A0A8K0UYF8_9AGAR|nr:cytochrome b-c1 complex subunit 10 [Cristinia sonorae]